MPSFGRAICVLCVMLVLVESQDSDSSEDFTCPALISDFLDFTCLHNAQVVNCSERVLSGATAGFKCKPGYEARDDPGYDTVHCDYGNWEKEIFTTCAPAAAPESITSEEIMNAAICGQTATQPAISARFGSREGITDMFQMPWIALLVYNSTKKSTQSFYCTGSIISPRFLLTSASCVIHLKPTVTLVGVLLGEHDYAVTTDCGLIDGEMMCAPPPVHIPIVQIIPHSQYNRITLQNNIALLRLERNMDFSLDSVKPICLPMDAAEKSREFTDEMVSVAGWGLDNRGVKNTVLYKRDQQTKGNKECKRKYPKRKTRNFVVNSTNICFGGDAAQDSCHGDKGGPIVHRGLGDLEDKTVLYGIRSHGPLCNETKQPSVATRVGAYIDWILGEIGTPLVTVDIDTRSNFN